MTVQDYRVLKFGSWCSAGMFGAQIYAFQLSGGPFGHNEYYQISAKEFEDFPENQYDLAAGRSTLGRRLCSDYRGEHTFDEQDFL